MPQFARLGTRRSLKSGAWSVQLISGLEWGSRSVRVRMYDNFHEKPERGLGPLDYLEAHGIGASGIEEIPNPCENWRVAN